MSLRNGMVRDGSKKFIRMLENSKVFLHLSVLGAEGLIPRISFWIFPVFSMYIEMSQVLKVSS